MVTGRETNVKMSEKERLKIKKKYEKKLLASALKLCFYQIKYHILSGIADFIFSGEKQKTTKFLMFANKSVSKNICKCQTTSEKCEYYKQKIISFT